MKISFKNTVYAAFLAGMLSGYAQGNNPLESSQVSDNPLVQSIKTGAENTEKYLTKIYGKRVGVLTNQTGIVLAPIKFEEVVVEVTDDKEVETKTSGVKLKQHHLVDFLLENNINVQKIYAPEHGFRGTADAGELIKDGKDNQTGLPIISLYGNNKKPSKEQLSGIDVMLFDLQDVGARFYTYISSLHYLMEACAENNIPLIVLDRPNPNGSIVDGPVLEPEHKSFVGMHPIPVLHGMTVGEYAKMINGEKWLASGVSCDLTVVECVGYNRALSYSLPVSPSPNLPNDQAINLYASLCFFEGTNVSVGRGTSKQFQVFGSPYLQGMDYTFTPKPNLGAKDPMHNGKECFGRDLSKEKKVNRLELKWLIEAYNHTSDKSKFFNSFFVKLAGTKKLQQQIEQGMSESQIRETWAADLKRFKTMRLKYLIYN